MIHHLRILAVFLAVMTVDVSVMIPSLHDGLGAWELVVATAVTFAGIVGISFLMSQELHDYPDWRTASRRMYVRDRDQAAVYRSGDGEWYALRPRGDGADADVLGPYAGPREALDAAEVYWPVREACRG